MSHEENLPGRQRDHVSHLKRGKTADSKQQQQQKKQQQEGKQSNQNQKIKQVFKQQNHTKSIQELHRQIIIDLILNQNTPSSARTAAPSASNKPGIHSGPNTTS